MIFNYDKLSKKVLNYCQRSSHANNGLRSQLTVFIVIGNCKTKNNFEIRHVIECINSRQAAHMNNTGQWVISVKDVPRGCAGGYCSLICKQSTN